MLILSVAVYYLVRPTYNGLTETFSGSQVSQPYPFTVINPSNLRFHNLLAVPNQPALLYSFQNLTQATEMAEPMPFGKLVANATDFVAGLSDAAYAGYVADLDVARVYDGSATVDATKPVRCFGTAGSPLVWVNGFCVSYADRKIYHGWTANYYHNGEEARGGVMTNAVMFFEYDGAFLDRRLTQTLIPDAVAVTGFGYFVTNHAWKRTITDPFSFQAVRDDGAAIVVVSFVSVLNFNGAKVLLGLQAPNPCYDVLAHLNWGYTNLVSTEYIWLGPQLATYILQFVVVLAALGSASHDVSSSVLVDLVSATSYSLVLLIFSLLGKYYLVFNLSSVLISDSVISLYLIAVISFYHNLIISH
ncbi:hypothetical protein ACHHYP_00063, partial [Achlya hypogyna]